MTGRGAELHAWMAHAVARLNRFLALERVEAMLARRVLPAAGFAPQAACAPRPRLRRRRRRVTRGPRAPAGDDGGGDGGGDPAPRDGGGVA